MNLKVLEFLVKHDLIPLRTRWEQSVSAVGSMYRRFYSLQKPEERRLLSGLMEEWGKEHAGSIREELNLPCSLHGCALALLTYHRIFGMKSRIVKENSDEVVAHVYSCKWKDKTGWDSSVCASIERFETGLVKGFSESYTHYYTKRRSLGDPVCEMHLTRTV